MALESLVYPWPWPWQSAAQRLFDHPVLHDLHLSFQVYARITPIATPLHPFHIFTHKSSHTLTLYNLTY